MGAITELCRNHANTNIDQTRPRCPDEYNENLVFSNGSYKPTIIRQSTAPGARVAAVGEALVNAAEQRVALHPLEQTESIEESLLVALAQPAENEKPAPPSRMLPAPSVAAEEKLSLLSPNVETQMEMIQAIDAG